MSQLLSRIESELTTEADPSRRAILLSRKAGYLARVGSFQQARGLVAELRAHYSDGSSPRVSVWIMLAEGLLHTFERLSPEGLDRIVRAEALALAMRDRQLIAWSSSWHAYWQFERSEFAGMTRSLQTALSNAEAGEHESLARACMVLANAYASCGELGPANSWYVASRDHALAAGDQATIEALMYNRAAFALAWLRAQACLGRVDESALDRVGKEIASAKNFQVLTGVAAFTDFTRLWQARVELLRGNFQPAIDGLDAIRQMQPHSPYSFDSSLVDLEVAYCLARLGRTDEALARCANSRDFNVAGLHEDEQLVIAWLRDQLGRMDPRLADPEETYDDLEKAKKLFADAVFRISSSLQPFSLTEPPGAVSLPSKRGPAVGP